MKTDRQRDKSELVRDTGVHGLVLTLMLVSALSTTLSSSRLSMSSEDWSSVWNGNVTLAWQEDSKYPWKPCRAGYKHCNIN